MNLQIDGSISDPITVFYSYVAGIAPSLNTRKCVFREPFSCQSAYQSLQPSCDFKDVDSLPLQKACEQRCPDVNAFLENRIPPMNAPSCVRR